MTINFKTNVRTVIRYKGQEYSSADQLPAEVRSVYESALAGGTTPTAAPGMKQHVVLNGQHFSSPDEMSAVEKKLYDDAIAYVRENASLPAPPNSSSSWLTPNQWRLVWLIAAITGLAVLTRLFF